jgi:signal transduction histidine kinase
MAHRLLRNDRTVGRRAEVALQLIDAATDTIQRIAADLRPPLLDELGLRAAIEWQAKDFSQRSGILCELRLTPDELELNGDQTTTVFRVLQEALTNVARHAQADWVTVRLEAVERRLILAVYDNGRGIPADSLRSSGSLGLVGMRERALAQDGLLEIESAPGEGTTLRLTLPLQPAAARGSAG